MSVENFRFLASYPDNPDVFEQLMIFYSYLHKAVAI